MTRQHGDGIIFGPTEELQIGPVKFLRPKPEEEEEMNTKMTAILVSKEMVLEMMNDALKKNVEYDGSCLEPKFKIADEVKKGVVARWSL